MHDVTPEVEQMMEQQAGLNFESDDSEDDPLDPDILVAGNLDLGIVPPVETVENFL